jgi:iron complex transport system permease protein
MHTRFLRLHFLYLAIVVLGALLHVHGGYWSNIGSFQFSSLWQFDAQQMDHVLFREIHFPRTSMAILAGAGLSIAGLLMQTLFNNPLAGPSVLGITTGSSLFVAISMLSGISFFTADLSLIAIALFGALVFSGIIVFFSLFVKSQVSLLLVGMMLGSFTSAIIQIIQLSTHADRLKAFTLWGFGSLQQVNFNQLGIILLVFLIGIVSLLALIKPLNVFVLGEKTAKTLGFKVTQIRVGIIVVSAIFTGLITAFCGPIAFIGLAVPNITKLIYKTQNHTHLLLGTALIGALTLILCDLTILWLEPYFVLPLNGITALLGAPIVVWIILKRF